MSVRVHWGVGIGLVYAAFAAATLGFAVFAMEQPVDLVSGDYYQRALDHDSRMAAEANAARLGKAFRVDLDAQTRAVTVTWTSDIPPAGAGTITLYRASGATLDWSVPVHPDADGRQSVPLDGSVAGHWRVQVQWRSDGSDFYAERTVIVR